MPLYGFLRDGRPSALEGDALTVHSRRSSPSATPTRATTPRSSRPPWRASSDARHGALRARRRSRRAGPAAEAAPPPAPQTQAALPDFTDQIRAAQAKLDAELLPDEQ